MVSVSWLQSNWYAFFSDWTLTNVKGFFFCGGFSGFLLACAFQDHLLNLVLDFPQYFLDNFFHLFKYCLLFSLSHSSLHCDLQIYVDFPFLFISSQFPLKYMFCFIINNKSWKAETRFTGGTELHVHQFLHLDWSPWAPDVNILFLSDPGFYAERVFLCWKNWPFLTMLWIMKKLCGIERNSVLYFQLQCLPQLTSSSILPALDNKKYCYNTKKLNYHFPNI